MHSILHLFHHHLQGAKAADLDEAIDAASGNDLPVRCETHNLRMALLAKFDGALQGGGIALHFVPLPLSCASEQVQGCAGWQQALMLLPACKSYVSS